MSMAPGGILELADEPLFRIVYANTTAQRLLVNKTSPGTPLGFSAPNLATLVAYHRLDADASFEVELDGGTCRATIRRTGWSLLVYLDSTSDDVALLRRAIATTAHEIRGPVAVICGIAEASGWDGEAQLDPEMQGRLMSSVARQARMLDSITADLLTAAQIQRGTLRIDLTPLDPRQVVESVAGDRYGIDVEVVVEDDRMVRADPLRLEQMVSNLLGNAIKYGEAPYTIRIRPDAQHDDHVAIDVVDRGAGVPEEFRGQLFKEFSRATRSPSWPSPSLRSPGPPPRCRPSPRIPAREGFPTSPRPPRRQITVGGYVTGSRHGQRALASSAAASLDLRTRRRRLVPRRRLRPQAAPGARGR